METSFQDRAAIISQFRNLLQNETPRLAEILSNEMGKPIKQALNEIKATAPRIDYFLQHTEEAALKQFDARSKPGLREFVTYEPLGVIANISAWNYAYFVGSNVFIPALLTGNAVLYKPSEFTTMTGLAITELMHKAGVPKEIFSSVIGPGSAVGPQLLSHKLNGVFFTGSYKTGKHIAATVAAAPHMMARVNLELGGKDPVYVMDDVDRANLKSVAESIADGAFYNNGQSCCSVERIYVHEDIYDEFVQHFVQAVKDMKMGSPLDENTYLGPLARPQHLEFLKAQVCDAVAKGARILTGGKQAVQYLPGAYFEPTVLVNVNHTMDVMREETFGPIIGIMKVKNDQEAVQLMNDTEYGLTASVYSRDERRARAVLHQMQTGTVYWNCCDRVSPYLPWSGRNHSGLGSTMSYEGIRAFVQPKAWHMVDPK
eukprot:GEZU01002918.1.p1 GENE.GEZU01002918.1~~GEZU01002918.1.p1  ORF type:complete len:429 (-),score=127.30 GEZU01002918.1:100-1386(-)